MLNISEYCCYTCEVPFEDEGSMKLMGYANEDMADFGCVVNWILRLHGKKD